MARRRAAKKLAGTAGSVFLRLHRAERAQRVLGLDGVAVYQRAVDGVDLESGPQAIEGELKGVAKCRQRPALPPDLTGQASCSKSIMMTP